MHRLAVGLIGCALASCGPGPEAWLGTWDGSITVNAGRQPETSSGSLTIAASGAQVQLTARSTVAGSSGSLEYTCAGLTTATADGTRLTLAAPATCELTLAPADTCTRQVVLAAGELTRTGDTLAGTAQGRLTVTCTGPGGGISDFALTASGTRR